MTGLARICLVTGAASGIGAAIAVALAGQGVALMLHARANRAGLERVAGECGARGARTAIVLGDLSQAEVPERLVQETVAAFGGLSVLVSNAGFSVSRPFGVATAEDLNRCHAAMAEAFFRLATAAMPHLEAASQARVVAISSLGAHVFRSDSPSFPTSAAAKAAIESMARSLAVTLAPKGITVNCVAPGFVRKEAGTHTALAAETWAEIGKRIPMGRVGEPEEIAAVVAFLASTAASYVTGQVIHANGGLI
jgi:3-oxoacyl-[acyl-carrier protein] reductase